MLEYSRFFSIVKQSIRQLSILKMQVLVTVIKELKKHWLPDSIGICIPKHVDCK
jgi:hypothetical protein